MSEPAPQQLRDIHLTERRPSHLQVLRDESAIYRATAEQFRDRREDGLYILLLNDERTTLRLAQASIPDRLIRVAERCAGITQHHYRLNLDRAPLLRRVVHERETIETSVGAVADEAFPRPIGTAIVAALGYEDKRIILTPLHRNGTTTGVLTFVTPEAAGRLLPFLRSVASHLSATLELSDQEARRRSAEASLRMERDFNGHVLDTAGALIVVLDREGRILRFNRACQRATGCRSNEVRGRRVWELFIPPGERGGVIHSFRELRAGHFPNTHVNHWRANGRELLISWSNTCVRDAAGQIAYIVGTGIDITVQREVQAALRRSERNYRGLIEDLNDVIFSIDAGARITYISPQIEPLLGYQPKELTRRSFLDLVHPNDLSRVQAAFHETLSGALRPDEYRLLRKSGEPIWVRSSSRPAKEGGRAAGLRGVLTDLTAHRMADLALRQSEGRYQHLLRNAPTGILALDLNGRIQDANPRALEILGIASLEIAGQINILTFPPIVQSGLDQCFRGCVDNHQAALWERPYQPQQGRRHFLRCHFAPSVSENGRLMGILANLEDITQAKQAEQSLRASELFNRTIVTSVGEGVVVYDPELRYRTWNRFMETLTGLSAKEVVGKLACELFPHLREQGIDRLLRRVLQGETVESSDIPFRVPQTGKTGWVAGVYTPHRAPDGRIIGAVATIRDVTQRKMAEQEVRFSLGRLRKTLSDTVDALATLVERRDPYTAGHQRRVYELATVIAMELDLSSEQIEGLGIAALVHDVGKVNVPAEFLSKPGRLSEIEFGLLQNHPLAGYEILRGIDFPWPVAQTVLQHHERLDGSGYPRGLQGEDILLEARIVAVADVVEAMSSHRPYRPALGIEKALAEISHGRAIGYDERVVDACLRLFREKDFHFSS